MTRTMEWLPLPTEAQIENLRSKTVVPEDDIPILLGLAKPEWGASELRRIAKRLHACLASTAGQAAAQSANVVPLKLLIFSNATANHLAETITGTSIRHGLAIETMIVEYEEPEAYLARSRAEIDAFAPDAVLLHYNAYGFSLREDLRGEPSAAVEGAIQRLNVMRSVLADALQKPIILQTLPTEPTHSLHHADRLIAGSVGEILRDFNNRLQAMARDSGDLVLDIAGMAESVGLKVWHSARYWALAKYPFAPELAPYFAEHLCRLLALKHGKSKRVLVLDLDDTVWGGIVGDDGKENLVIGAGNAVGEAHAAIQSMAKALTRRGILLTLCSKNEESVALDAFETHPEMILKRDDITAYQINWIDKAANIAALSKTLNLGLDAFVFIDDNPAERARVRDALPDVAVPELPKDITEWLPVIQEARYFETAGFSTEDALRTEMYRANAKRASQVESFADHDAYLASLNMVMDTRPFDAMGRKRIAQLIAKSNQFNLTTIRRSEEELAAIEADPTYLTLQIRLADTFGDNGMIAVVIAKILDDALDIDTWLMSCRVLGRGVERKTLDLLVDLARSHGKSIVSGTYIPTPKNVIVKDHYASLGFVDMTAGDEDGTTRWELSLDTYETSASHIRLTTDQQDI